MRSDRHNLLTADEEVTLARQAAIGDMVARDQMILSNNRLVWKIAKKYESAMVDVDDLVQEGQIGLVHAVRKYNPELGFRFSTYATQWITQYILIWISRTTGTIRSTNTVHWKQRKYEDTFDQLASKFGREPTDLELQEALQVSEGGLECIRKAFQANSRHGFGLAREAVAKDPLPDENCERQELIDSVTECLRRLDERERDIIRKRFGIGTNRKLTLRELADEYGVARERIRQIEAASLDKLRRMLSR